MKQMTMYSVPGTNLADSLNKNSLREFADEMGYANKPIVEIQVPWLEDGDKIIIQYCTGATEDENGISSGGQWVDIEGRYEEPEDRMMGRFVDKNGNTILTCMDADMRYDGYPYRNVRILA